MSALAGPTGLFVYITTSARTKDVRASGLIVYITTSGHTDYKSARAGGLQVRASGHKKKAPFLMTLNFYLFLLPHGRKTSARAGEIGA